MKNAIITVLAILVLCMGGYLVYDKVIDNDDINAGNEEQKNPEVNDSTNNAVIEQKDASFFNEYLKAFLECDGLSVSRNTENFSEEDISYFVSRYYNLLSSGEGVYKVNVSDVDALIHKYFNKNNVNLKTNLNEVTKITKQDNIYTFEWLAVGCGYNSYVDPIIVYNGENVTVRYSEYEGPSEQYTGKYLTFYLKYNNGNYNVIKIAE